MTAACREQYLIQFLFQLPHFPQHLLRCQRLRRLIDVQHVRIIWLHWVRRLKQRAAARNACFRLQVLVRETASTAGAQGVHVAHSCAACTRFLQLLHVTHPCESRVASGLGSLDAHPRRYFFADGFVDEIAQLFSVFSVKQLQ